MQNSHNFYECCEDKRQSLWNLFFMDARIDFFKIKVAKYVVI